MVLNAISAAVWAVLITAIGWTFGRTAELALGRIDRVEHKLLAGLAAGILVAVAVYYLVRLLRARTE
jgi:membrane protein DedA with SNARE-associated domain